MAEPWWVNLLFLFPFAAYFFWKESLRLTKKILIIAFIFGAAFGFVEAAVVIYLRAAVGLLPGYGGTLTDVVRLSSAMFDQAQILGQLPQSLFIVELFREAATIVMLAGVAFLTVRAFKERCAVFFWTFAVWDIFYYVGLWAAVRWPNSFIAPDVLFLIPVPWYSQVWFPILISGLTMLVIIMRISKKV